MNKGDYPPREKERIMKVQEVLLRAASGKITWFAAAEILGVTDRSMRRWKERLEREGYEGLYDRRRRLPSPKRVDFEELERVLHLYREQYQGYNVAHFHEVARREHGVRLSYSFVKKALQTAGLVAKRRARGRHRLRRERRACLGEMLHLDGSPHVWLALRPDERQTLIAVVDDATSRILYAALEESESAAAVMRGLHAVITTDGLPMCLYTDRASWAAHTPRAGGPPDRSKLTQVGRALKHLGIEHILAGSPQARGRGERVNRTLQDRLVNELRTHGITTIEEANRYLREVFIPRHNERFAVPPRDPDTAFVPLGAIDLDQILCHQEERTVAKDNTITLEGLNLQIYKQPGRVSCAGLVVTVRRHLDGTHTLWRGTQLLGRYTDQGKLGHPQRRTKGGRPGATLPRVSTPGGP